MTEGSKQNERITPSEIEGKFRELQGEVDLYADEARSYALTAGLVIGAGIVVVAFWLGRRRGRKKTTIVEIRRV